MNNKGLKIILFTIIFLGLAIPVFAQEQESSQINTLTIAIDTLWVLIAGFLVFFMNLGFGMVESGLCRVKNTVNILAKNFIVFAVASISFWIIGWGLMFGNGNGFFGLEGLFFASGADNSPMPIKAPMWQ